MNDNDLQLIQELAADVYDRNICLLKAIKSLKEEEVSIFQDEYDKYVVNGSHNAP